jgi:hypothetical protein
VEKVYTANSLKVLIIELSVEPIHLKFSVHMFLWIFYSLNLSEVCLPSLMLVLDASISQSCQIFNI